LQKKEGKKYAFPRPSALRYTLQSTDPFIYQLSRRFAFPKIQRSAYQEIRLARQKMRARARHRKEIIFFETGVKEISTQSRDVSCIAV